MGAMLGFLPCGLSYGAFAQALGSASAAAGALLAILAFAAWAPSPVCCCWAPELSALFSRYRRPSDLISGILMIYMAVKMGYKAIKMVL